MSNTSNWHYYSPEDKQRVEELIELLRTKFYDDADPDTWEVIVTEIASIMLRYARH